MSENEKIETGKPENEAVQEEQTKAAAPVGMSPMEAAEKVSAGKFRLMVPIEDGDKKYTELIYDFNKLTGWELAKAVDSSAERNNNPGNVTDTQALSLFAAAAAKCTGGLDAVDIRDRMSALDAIAAINVASIFFRGSLLAGSMRITSA